MAELLSPYRQIQITGNLVILLAAIIVTIILSIVSVDRPVLQTLTEAFDIPYGLAGLALLAIGVITALLWNGSCMLANRLITKNPSYIKIEDVEGNSTELTLTQNTPTDNFNSVLSSAPTINLPKYSDPRLTQLHELFLNIFFSNEEWEPGEEAFIKGLLIQSETIHNQQCCVLYSVENNSADISDVQQKFQLLRFLRQSAAPYIRVDNINSPLKLDEIFDSTKNTSSYKLYIESKDINTLLTLFQQAEQARYIKNSNT